MNGYSLGSPYGVPYELLVITNPQERPDLQPPREATWKNILCYYVFDPHSQFFPGRYYPKLEDETQAHGIRYLTNPVLISDTDYELTFWVKMSNIHDLAWEFTGKEDENNNKEGSVQNIKINNAVANSPSWTQVNDKVRWNHHFKKDHVSGVFKFDFIFYGQGELDIADLRLTKD